jgi:signal transduction histidine kinase
MIRQMRLGLKLSYTFFIGLTAAAGILFSVTYFTTFYEKKNTIDDFNNMVDAAMMAIDKTADQYELVLNGTSGAFSMKKNEVEPEEWRMYVDSIHPTSYFESVNGLGFIAKIKKNETESFMKKHNMKLKQLDENYSNLYDDRFIITFVEPLAGNIGALGLDAGSEPRRREAAENSRRLHRTYATDPIQLVQDKESRKGFLIFHPTYNNKNEFIGWTYAPVISQIFFSKTLTSFTDTLRMRLKVKGEQIYNSDSTTAPFRHDSFYKKKEINIFGNIHTLEFYPTDLFFRRHSDYSVAIPLILNLLVLILAALSIEQITFSHRAEDMILERTKELDASKMQLVESSKMASLGEMASGMAHEINNPLTIIQGKLQVIQIILNDLNVKDKALFDELGKIKTTTDRIEKIVKGLRNFSRAANMDPFELTALKPVVTETLELCAEKIRAEGINLIVSEIPQVSVRCRPSQVSQVLINLLNNSRDAIQDSSSKWIELGFKIEQNKVQIILTDSGPGISAEVADRMMEPFFTTKEVGKGTGLGLSISKGIIAAHGGKLWLDTTSINTRFIIELRYYT